MALNRVVAGGALCAAVAVGAVGGAVIGVPGLSAASQFPAAASASNTAQTSAGVTTQAGPHGFMKDGLIDAAAKALNLTPQQLMDKLKDGKTTIADVAKEQNVPLDQVVQAMADADKDRIEKIVNQPWPTPPVPGAPGLPGGLGFGVGHGPNGAHFGGAAGVGIDALAKALGITPEQLQQDLKDGKSIADIAKGKNLDVNKLILGLVDQADAKIDQAVKDKHLTQEQGDALKKGLKEMVSAFVNGELPKFGGKGGMFGGHFGFGGPDKPGVPGMNPATPPTTTP